MRSLALALSLLHCACSGDADTPSPPRTTSAAVGGGHGGMGTGAGGGDDGGTGGAGGRGPEPPTRLTEVGPDGGWIASVAFRSADEVWVSADDTGGLWRSVDGAQTWDRVAAFPQEHATYALRFHVSDPDRVYAPSYAGLGLARSLDGGETWEVLREGLPTSPNDAVSFDLAQDPTDPERLFLATRSGLFVSNDEGASWTLAEATPEVTAVAFLPSGGALFHAAGDEVRVSLDGGSFVSVMRCERLGAPAVVTDLAATDARVYVGCAGGVVIALEVAEDLAPTVLADGTELSSGLWTHVEVEPGPTPAEDRLLIGTTAPSEGEDYGVFASLDGGRSFSHVVAGTSAFGLAWHPEEPGTAIVGGAPDRLRLLTGLDGGAPAALEVGAFGVHCCTVVVDPRDPDHWLLSSSVLLSGMPHTLWETRDAGSTWSEWEVVDPVTGQRHVNAWQLHVDGDVVHVATPAGVTGGRESTMLRSATGVAGPFVAEDLPPVLVESIEVVGSTYLAGAAFGLARAEDAGLYAKHGATGAWTRELAGSVRRVVAAPRAAPARVAALGEDAHLAAVAGDGALGPWCSIGFASAFPGESLTAGDLTPTGTLWVGGESGRIFVFEAAGACEGTWSEATSPFGPGTAISGIFHEGADGWLVGGRALSGQWPETATPGLERTHDAGRTWTRIEAPSLPSEIPYTLSRRGARGFLVGTVAAGILALE